MFFSKGVLFAKSPYNGCWLTCSRREGYAYKMLFFSLVILPETSTVSLSQEFKWSGRRNKFRTGAIFQDNQLFNRKPWFTSSLSIPVCQFVKDKKNAMIFPGSKYLLQRTPQNPRKIGKSLPEYLTLQGRSEFFVSIKSRTP